MKFESEHLVVDTVIKITGSDNSFIFWKIIFIDFRDGERVFHCSYSRDLINFSDRMWDWRARNFIPSLTNQIKEIEIYSQPESAIKMLEEKNRKEKEASERKELERLEEIERIKNSRRFKKIME